MTMLDFALKYATAGYRVIPCNGKVPLVPRGAHDATTDETTLRAWWERWPSANVAMTLDGLVCVDIDPRNGGDCDEWQQKLPESCYARTGGGGLHFLYRTVNGTRYPGKLGPGVDVKTGAGAYIVVEPSVHPSGERYVWIDESEPWGMKPAEAPAWLAQKPQERTAQARVQTDTDLLRDLRSALTAIRSDDYHEWIRIGHALASLGDLGRALWLEWSSTSEKYDAADAARRWDTFHPRATGHEAVFAAAQAAGWLNPAKGRTGRAGSAEGASDWTADVPPPEGATEAPRRATSAGWPSPIDLCALASREPEQPQFIVKDWLPAGYGTLLAGHGGVGKSAIALHLAVCIALGRDFAGLDVAPRRVLYLSCEDRENVLHWRLDRICRHLRISIANLAGKLDIVELVGRDAMLWDRDPRTGLCHTAAFGELEARMRESGAEVLMVDGVSDTFGGNENARTEVKRYVNALLGLVPSDTGALLLVGHVAKLTAGNAATSEGYSGSTGWHNSVRARWYLYPEVERGDDERPQRTGRLALELQKSNLGPTDAGIAWQWSEQAHMFLPEPEPAPSHFDRKHQQEDEQRGILLAMKGCADAGIYVPAATQGKRTALIVLAERAEFPASLKGPQPVKSRRFWRHIEHLRQIRQIDTGEYRRKNRHTVETFTLTTEGMRQCAE